MPSDFGRDRPYNWYDESTLYHDIGPDPTKIAPTAPTVSAVYNSPNLADIDVNKDPAYLMYLRSLGLSQGQQDRQIERQRAFMNESLAARRPVWEDQRQQAMTGIETQYGGQGTFNSDARRRADTRANTNVDRQIAEGERQNKYSLGNLDAQRDNSQMSSEFERQQQELAARQRGVTAQTTYGLQ